MALYPYFPVLTVRWPGVLQRIGVCYLAAWAAKRWLRPRGQAVLAACLLVGYWALMTKVTGPEGHPPNLEMQTNLSAQVDRIVLVPHVWSVTKTWDPEGVLSTLPAIATTLLGLLFGEWVRSGRRPFATTLGLLLGGLALTALGVLWGEAAPPWLALPDQQEHLDVVLRPAHRRPRRRPLRAHLLGRGRGGLEAVGRAVRDLRQERDRGVRGLGPPRQDAPLHQVAGRLRRGGEPLAAPLPGALRELAPALRGLASPGRCRWSSSSTSSPSGWTAGASTSRSDERGPSRHRRAEAAGGEDRPEDDRGPRRAPRGRLPLAAREGEPGRPGLPRGRERVHRRGDEADGGLPAGALRGDARPHPGDGRERSLPQGRLLLLLAHRAGEAVPDLLPQEGQPGGARRR